MKPGHTGMGRVRFCSSKTSAAGQGVLPIGGTGMLHWAGQDLLLLGLCNCPQYTPEGWVWGTVLV